MFVMLLIASSVYAEGYTPFDKLGRGMANLALGSFEIPRQIIRVNKGDDEETTHDVAGIFLGPAKGVAYFIGRTAVGFYEVATFMLPPYEPVIKPEYIFSEEE